MNTASKITQLILLTLGTTLVYAGPAHIPVAPRVAINPQPLPPRHDGGTPRFAINPQPLPPRHDGGTPSFAINPQPLPPRGGPESVRHDSLSRPYIGETEKNLR